jgi:16S rRNA (cytidine1402-2'-O)-methyltransferase
VIADPGCFLVAAAHSHGIQVVSVPGASALTAAVAAAGLSGDTFFFQGCLPESTSSMKRCLADCLKNQTSTVAFCTPISLALVLRTIAEIAPRRSIALACDLTKPEELIIRGTARQVQQRLDSVPEPQDVTLILTGGKTIADKRAGKK